MKTLLLAIRNLLRNRRRSFTTLVAMIIGASSVMLFGGYGLNIAYGLQTRFVQRSGHLQIQHKDFFLYGNGNPTAFGVSDYERIIDAIKSDPVLAPMVAVATPTLQITGIAGNFEKGVSRTVIGSGVIVDDQNEIRLWNDYGLQMKPRPLALTDTNSDAAVIGTGVARVLQLCASLHVSNCHTPSKKQLVGTGSMPDDIASLSKIEKPTAANSNETRIELLSANIHGAPNVVSLAVAKAEPQGMKEFDDSYIGLHLVQAQKLLFGNLPPHVTAIVIQLKHTAQIPAAKARLEQLLESDFKDQSLGTIDFATLNPLYGQSIALYRTIFGCIALLIGAIVLFTVGNTMSMAVVERTVEIGTLRSIGLRRSGIRRLFMCEGLLLGVSGAMMGVMIAILLATAVNHSGLTWTPPGYVEPVPLNISVWGEYTLISGTAFGLILVAVLSAFWPANRASKMIIVEALRHA